MNGGEVTPRQTYMRKKNNSVLLSTCLPFGETVEQPAPKHTNAVTEQFMALQKYLLMFKAQYQTQPMNLMKKKVQNIQISNTYSNKEPSKSRMGTALEETLRYALDYSDGFGGEYSVLVTT